MPARACCQCSCGCSRKEAPSSLHPRTQGTEIHELLQCKRTTSVDAEVVAEVMQAFDGYRARWPRLRIGTYILRAVLVTNGAFTAKAQREAKIRSIDLIAADDLGRLLAEIPCTLAEVEMMEDRRLASMRDVQVAIESLVSSLP